MNNQNTEACQGNIVYGTMMVAPIEVVHVRIHLPKHTYEYTTPTKSESSVNNGLWMTVIL